jgi:hypothetical protein
MLTVIDESIPESARGHHYVISSAVILGDVQACRDRIAELSCAKNNRRHPFHFSNEGVQLRDAMVECIGEVGIAIVTVIHDPVPAKRQAAARAATMTKLLTELDQEGVTEVLIESRGIQDRDDRSTILAAQEAGHVNEKLVYSFGGKSERLLWLPDATAGIYGEAEIGRNHARLVRLQQVVIDTAVYRI